MSADALLEIESLVVAYRAGPGRKRQAVSNVGLKIAKGESLGLAGESGCGKSSLAKAVMQLIRPVSGQIRLNNENLTGLPKSRLRQLRPKFQMIFQDAASALNPRRTIGRSIAMPLALQGGLSRAQRKRHTCQMMERVGLDPALFDLLPYQLSGGQCQRVQIARALICEPELLICDEPVSSLDPLARAQIIGLLDRLRKHSQLSMLFISHDLAVLNTICDRLAVMYAGKLCEVSDCVSLYQAPLPPYTQTLLAAIPALESQKNHRPIDKKAMEGYAFDHAAPGCPYRTRCYKSKGRCRDEAPLLTERRPAGHVACHYPLPFTPTVRASNRG